LEAKILPLDGKYYGTCVELTTDDGTSSWIQIWHTDSSKPSEREIADWEGEYEICDSHYESQTAYEVAQKIVEMLNRKPDEEYLAGRR
jgi:hypothetical protein